jgi:hypothetical protein
VLGGKVNVAWAKIMHAGEFTHGTTEVVNAKGKEVSIPCDPGLRARARSQGTAYHESLHAFFQMLREQGNHDIMKVLYRAADTAPVMNQLRRLLKDEPEALKQIESDREERVAYMYQFYAKEKITLGADTSGVFAKPQGLLLSVLGMWTNDQRAEHIMDWFHEGQFVEHIGDRSAVTRALHGAGAQ